MRKFLIVPILIMIILAIMPSTAFAVTYVQPTQFTVTNEVSYALQSVLEPGDQFFICQFYINYATPSDAPPSVGEAYLGSVRYNGVLIGTVQPYAFFDVNGTSEWFYSVYLSASEVTAWNTFFGVTMWNNSANYSMQMVGNPTLTWAGGSPPAPQTTSAFSFISFNTNLDVATTTPIVTNLMRTLADHYEQRFYGLVDLVQEIGGMRKLTTDGERYFTNSIASLRIMCPDLFADTLNVADMVDEKLITDYYIDLTDTNVPIYGAEWSAQTFTATDNYDISGVDVRLYRVGAAPGTVTVRLRAVALGVPSGADLAIGTINGNTLSTYDRGEWYNIIFTTNVTLISGTTYSIVVDASTGNINNYIVWRDDSTGTYTGGTRCASVNSGGAWGIYVNDDFIFTILSIEGVSGSYQAKLSSHLDETEFGLPADSINNLATSWGLSRNWATSLIWLMLAIGLGIVSSLALHNNRPLFPVILIMLPIGNYTGFLLLNITIITGLICALALVYVFAFSKSV